jgi:hypothetical protein
MCLTKTDHNPSDTLTYEIEQKEINQTFFLKNHYAGRGVYTRCD